MRPLTMTEGALEIAREGALVVPVNSPVHVDRWRLLEEVDACYAEIERLRAIETAARAYVNAKSFPEDARAYQALRAALEAK